ncbi:MAG: hypothetical protein K2H43_04625, partial [Clostridia bacterium]|nr:hypothetical protein [Clostridia bacterium]
SVQEFMRDIDGHMKRNEDGKFTLACENGTLTYSVHYRQYTQRYGIYMSFTEGEAKEEVAPWTWETQDTVQPGYGQYENDELHAMEENNTVGATNVAGLGTTRKANAGGSFTYRMTVDTAAQNRLVVTFSKEDNGKGILVKSGGATLYSETLSYEGLSSSYDVSIEIPQSVLNTAQEILYTDAGGNSVRAVVIPITFSGIGGKESARVCSYLYSQKRVFNERAQDGNVAYFVDCGDYDVYTTSAGDSIGKYQSVTEQVYGADAVTGKKWGIVDPHTANIAGAAEKGVATNSTWAYEFNADDGLDKTASNRYTKNQFESGVARNLHYKFDLDNGTYTVKVYFSDPWGCSKNPSVSANGEIKVASAAIGQEISFAVTVANGELALDFASSDLCINLCYITVLFAE